MGECLSGLSGRPAAPSLVKRRAVRIYYFSPFHTINFKPIIPIEHCTLGLSRRHIWRSRETSTLCCWEDSRQSVGDNVVFWTKDGKGYTSDVSQAHLLSEEQAQAQSKTRPTDIGWRARYLADKVRPVTDFQVLLRPERLREFCEGRPPTEQTRCFLTSERLGTVGNDVLVHSRLPGMMTTDLRKARQFKFSELAHVARTRIWPVEFVTEISRQAVNRQWVDRTRSPLPWSRGQARSKPPAAWAYPLGARP